MPVFASPTPTTEAISSSEAIVIEPSTTPGLLGDLGAKWPRLLFSAVIQTSESDHLCLRKTESIFEFSREEITPIWSGDAFVRYSTPIWSPDGQWIAYLVTEMPGAGETKGKDSIWVMKSDGTLPRRIGDPVENIYLVESNFCFHLGGIRARSMTWSADGNYLAYMTWEEQKDATIAHLLDINSGTSKRVSLSTTAEKLGWDDSANTLVISEREFLSVHLIHSIEDIQSRRVSYPSSYYVSYPFRVIFGYSGIISSLEIRNSVVTGSFRMFGVQRRASYPSLWQFDIQESSWTKVAETLPWGGPIFSGEFAIACLLSGNIAVLSQDLWEGDFIEIPHPPDEETWCYDAKIVVLEDGSAAISVLTRVQDDYGIYVIESPANGFLGGYLLAEELEKIGITTVTWYSWQPLQQ